MITYDLDNYCPINSFEVHPETFQNDFDFLNIMVAQSVIYYLIKTKNVGTF